MRDFTGVHHSLMIAEINRDLSKAPVVRSTRVQNREIDGTTREALNYQYVVNADDVLAIQPKEYFEVMAEYSDFYKSKENQNAVRTWLLNESAHRFFYPEVDAPTNHPELQSYLEGKTYSYTYGERITPYLDMAMTALMMQPTTRRVWIPIYTPHDLTRADQFTRIPCSLGYGVLIRKDPEGMNYLHMTYVQRSCDFEVFWITDLILAAKLMEFIQFGIAKEFENLRLGKLTHDIISFHRFLEEGAEIY